MAEHFKSLSAVFPVTLQKKEVLASQDGEHKVRGRPVGLREGETGMPPMILNKLVLALPVRRAWGLPFHNRINFLLHLNTPNAMALLISVKNEDAACGIFSKSKEAITINCS